MYFIVCLILLQKHIVYVKDLKLISWPQEFYRVVTAPPVLKSHDPVLFSIDIISYT